MSKKIVVILFLAMVGISVILFTSCGGGDGDSASTGVVALYATDDLSNYEQVIITVNSVQLVHTGSNSVCTIMDTPETMDLTDLSSEVQLLDTSICPARSYNRVRLEFDKQVDLMDPLREMASCTWRNYKGDNNNVNVLDCDETTCTLDINGAVNVFANQNNKVALDFDLKDFEVEQQQVQNTYNCEATMKVSPLNASGIEGKKGQGYRESINGSITNLNTTGDSFTIDKGNTTFTIDYSGVTQTGIDGLLQFAVDNDLNVKVKCDSIDLETNSCTATAVYVKVEGTISALGSETFTLTNEVKGIEITVNYIGADVEGTLADGVNVNVQISDYDGSTYFAYKVCVVE